MSELNDVLALVGAVVMILFFKTFFWSTITLLFRVSTVSILGSVLIGSNMFVNSSGLNAASMKSVQIVIRI